MPMDRVFCLPDGRNPRVLMKREGLLKAVRANVRCGLAAGFVDFCQRCRNP